MYKNKKLNLDWEEVKYLMQNLEERKDEIREVFDQIAAEFDVTRYKPWPESVSFIDSLAEMPDVARVLDIGCGNGRDTLYLAEKGFQVIALDISEKQLEVARKNISEKGFPDKVEFVQADASDLPLDDNSMDAALYIATLHHLPSEEERLSSLLELKRCLRPGSEALVSVWVFEQPKFAETLKRHMRDLKGKAGFGDVYVPWKRKDGKVFWRFYHLFLEEEFRDLIEKSGLEVLGIWGSCDNYYARVRKE